MSIDVKGNQGRVKRKGRLEVLKNPWLSVITMSLGIYVGAEWNWVGQMLRAPADLFLAMLTMSVLPIISTAIITGVARMLNSGLSSRFLLKMVLLFVVAAAAGSGIGIVAGYIGQPGANLGSASEAFIGRTLLNEASVDADDRGLWGLVAQLVPTNVFSAFSQGQILAVIFVSLLLGSTLGVSRSEAGAFFLKLMSGIHEAFVRILSWVLYALPFGLFFLMASQVSTLGIEALLGLSKFILVFYAAGLVLIIIYLLIMRIATGLPVLRIISGLREPLFVAFSAASSVAPIPIALQQMRDKLRQQSAIVDVVVPLSVAMGRHSYAMLFSLTAVFLSQLFNKPLDLYEIVLLFFMSALVGTAAAGRLAAAAVMLVYIVGPLGLPVSVGVTVYVTIGAILDPMVQMLILFGSCANSTVMARGLSADLRQQ